MSRGSFVGARWITFDPVRATTCRLPTRQNSRSRQRRSYPTV